MVEKFIKDTFLLGSEAAEKLYGMCADLPILDFHSHLDAAEVAEDMHWDNIAQVWLGGDHYKWRAMRSNGVEERFCTGDASDREKFFAFARTMPRLLRNPMYHWCHLELARFFGIDDVLLSEDTAGDVWDRANAVLAGGLGARRCLELCNVEVACTTDDPSSTLDAHKACAADKTLKTKILPTFRPDKAHAFGNPAEYVKYLEVLGNSANVKIESFDDLISALKNRHDYFDANGCRASDHGIDTVYFSENNSSKALNDAFKKVLAGCVPDAEEMEMLKSAVLIECAKMDAQSGWVRQMHIGPMRNNNTAMFKAIGPDTGFDSMGESNYAYALSRHLDTLSAMGKLGRTILYNIHPKDTQMLASMLGNFQDSECAGKLQLGSGWWFLDQMDGMKSQLEAVSAMSLLPNFVGMLTDSRSFLSYCRHEYFRRILCDMLGADINSGVLPKDYGLVGGAARDISYFNAKKYFKF